MMVGDDDFRTLSEAALAGAADTAPRLSRSLLSVPGDKPELFAKAASSKADAVILDLEDSVAPHGKADARAAVVTGLNTVSWGAKTVCLRVNGLDTPFMYRDIIDVIERGGDRLDTLMIPKVNAAAEVVATDILVSQVEAATGRSRRLGIEVLIETASGLSAIDAIAAASQRLEALHLGLGDFAATIGARTTVIGGHSPDYGVLAGPDGTTGGRSFYPGDVWHYALSRLLVAARANGLRPIDGPYADFRDAEGLASMAGRSAAMGFDGKWAIHPAQIAPINRAFTPTDDEIARARSILDAMQKADHEGHAAATLDGRMIDTASIRQADVLIKKVAMIAHNEHKT